MRWTLLAWPSVFPEVANLFELAALEGLENVVVLGEVPELEIPALAGFLSLK